MTHHRHPNLVSGNRTTDQLLRLTVSGSVEFGLLSLHKKQPFQKVHKAREGEMRERKREWISTDPLTNQPGPRP